MSDAYLEAVNKLRQDLEDQISAIKEDPKMAEVLRLHSALNVMEDLLKQPKTSLSELFGLEQGLIIHPDEFYGFSPLKAAKRFLRKKGKAASFREIIDAVRAGGVTIDSEDKFRVSLGRSTMDIVKIDSEHYGLMEFYPDAKRGRKKKSSVEGGQTGELETEESDLDLEDSESGETEELRTEANQEDQGEVESSVTA